MKAPTFLSEEELWTLEKSYFGRTRAAKILRFVDEVHGPVADIGDRNPLITMIEKEKGVSATSIGGLDLDYDEIPDGQYGTIFFFAVIEHLFNPLFALENFKKSMRPGGLLYLSTPHRPHFLWTEHHYHEIDRERLGWLFERAGFEVVKEERHHLRDRLHRHLTGVRPLIRYFHKSMGLYKLRKAE